MKLKLIVSVLSCLILAQFGLAAPPVKQPLEAWRIRGAQVLPGSRGKSDYSITFSFVNGKQVCVPFVVGARFAVVEVASISGTFVDIQHLDVPAGSIVVPTTIYVRNYTTRAAWEKVLSRYEVTPPEIPIDVTPSEPIGY